MKSRLIKRLKPYSITACGLIATVPASAGVIYTNIDPDTTLQSDTFKIDLNNDGTINFTLIQKTSFYAGNERIWTDSDFVIGATDCYIVGDVYNKAQKFNATSYVSAGLNWNAQIDGKQVLAKQTTVTSDYMSPLTYYSGNFLDTEDAFIGVRLRFGNDFHYGWIRVDVTRWAHKVTVKDYAYESTPMKPITTEIVLDINSLLPNNINIYSFGSKIFISSTTGTATIYNLTGQQVHQENLNGSSSIALPSGVYVVKVDTDGKSYSKKVLVD